MQCKIPIFVTHLYWKLTAGIVLVIVVGCGNNNNEPSLSEQKPVTSQFNKGENRWFETSNLNGEACPPDPIFNCTSDLMLCQDGSAFLLLTDIINGGSYTETDSEISTNWGQGDAPESMFF